jgi:predicted MFS family arabinose efflux permease
MIGATFLNAIAVTLIPLADGGSLVTIGMLMSAHFLMGLGFQIHSINLISMRQAITPDRLQGRMNAIFRFNNLCAITIGALMAGALGERIGLRATLAIAACGFFLPVLRLLCSPTRRLYEQPAPCESLV